MDWTFLGQPEFWAAMAAVFGGIFGGRAHARRQIKKSDKNDFDGTNV
jgi:hypothetical protein